MQIRTALLAGTAALAFNTCAFVAVTAPAGAGLCPVGGYFFKSDAAEIQGTDCPDHIVAGPNVIKITTGAGDDVVEVAGPADPKLAKDVQVFLGSGNDSVRSWRVRGAWYDGDSGNDYIETFSVAADFTDGQFLDGGTGNDTLIPAGVADVRGGDGDDAIRLKAGALTHGIVPPSRVDGGAGADLINSRPVLPEAVFIPAEEGKGTWYTVQLDGGPGNDTFLTNQAADQVGERIAGGTGIDHATSDFWDQHKGVETVVLAP